jgi:hypothetical protein
VLVTGGLNQVQDVWVGLRSAELFVPP